MKLSAEERDRIIRIVAKSDKACDSDWETGSFPNFIAVPSPMMGDRADAIAAFET